MYRSEARTVFSAGNGEVEVYELAIPGEWSGKTVADLIPCEDCKPIAITRAGKAFLADLKTVLKEGDFLNVAATFDGIEQTREALQTRQKEA
jgi:trk system potassium uptake protein TrkA